MEDEKGGNQTENIVVTGNGAASWVGYMCSDYAFIYPISPSSPMAEHADEMAAKKQLNLWGNIVKVSQLQSEAGAAGALHGSVVTGGLACTFTASQGLLLMIPNLYKMVGELYPAVLHVASRAIAGQALSIFGEHTDVMSVRSTGVCIVSSHSVQECADLALVSHVAALRASLPVIHFFDGYRLSHTMCKIKSIPVDAIKAIYEDPSIVAALARHRERALHPDRPAQIGSHQGPDVFFQWSEAANSYFTDAVEHYKWALDVVSKKLGRTYHMFDYVGHPQATDVIVMLGVGAQIVEETLHDHLLAMKYPAGIIKVHVYRPWSGADFMAVLPPTCRRICVLERVKENNAVAGPMYLDILATLHLLKPDSGITMIGGRWGLGSKDLHPDYVKAVYDNMLSPKPRRFFTVGIVDDVTHLSLPVSLTEPVLMLKDSKEKSAIIWGIGSDGSVGASEMICTIVGMSTNLDVQGYFSYDAHKAMGLTRSFLRFSPNPIKGHYLLKAVDFVSINSKLYIQKYAEVLVERSKPGSVIVLNSPNTTMATLEAALPNSLKKTIALKKMELYNIDAHAVADTVGNKFINVIMQAVFFRLSKILPEEQALGFMREEIKKTYAKKGPKVIELNLKSIDAGLTALWHVPIPASWADLPMTRPDKFKGKQVPSFVKEVVHAMELTHGDLIPVSKLTAGGRMPAATSQYEKRAIALKIPIWKGSCIQCNYCALVCPHAAIRSFLHKEQGFAPPASYVTQDAKGGKAADGSELRFRIQVAPSDCTGCEVCANSCPDKALTMTPIGEVFDKETVHWDYAIGAPFEAGDFDRYTVKGSMFQTPLLEFSGACAGCGETPYVKLATQLFGQSMIIANATGCTSIWGGTAALNPYCVNHEGKGPAWGNSLFEDNAEYGFGMATTVHARRKLLENRVNDLLNKNKAAVSAELVGLLTNWLQVKTDLRVCETLAPKVIHQLEKEAAEPAKKALLAPLVELKDYFKKLTIWLVGGDGWAYDIGYGGLDHVAASGIEVHILVLDTELYSNTGGQTSKATPLSATAKFAFAGKRRHKKDLPLLAMQYGDVYVASISLGASYQQAVKAFIEAESYPGVSLIVAYAPCVDHGYPLSLTNDKEREAVESGYWNLYRYDPRIKTKGDSPFQLDAKKIKSDLLQFVASENRYSFLTRTMPELASDLQAQLKAHTVERMRQLQVKELTSKPDFLEHYDKLVKGVKDDSPRLTILYGSETGHAEGVARSLSQDASARGYACVVSAADDFDFETLKDQKNLIVVIATAGQGDAPANATSFISFLSAPDRPKDLLANTTFSVFGLGDSSYALFCKAAEVVDSKLEALGGKRLMKRGIGDDQSPDGYEGAFVDWQSDFFTELKAPPPKETGAPPPSFTVTPTQQHNKDQATAPLLQQGTEALTMVTNKRLTPADYRDLRHYEFDISHIVKQKHAAPYQLGDDLAIYPRNPPDDVNYMLARLGLTPDLVLNVAPRGDGAKSAYPASMTARQLLEQVIDLGGKINPRLCGALSWHANDEKEREQLRLLSTPAGKQEFAKLAAESVTLVDLFKSFSKLNPPLDFLLSYAPKIRPRMYSIANSPITAAETGKLDLAIILVEWTTPGGKAKLGLSTQYLRALAPGAQLVVSWKRGLFRLPDPAKPIAMAALGTGIAPFRAFIQERARVKRSGKPVGETILYFGARHRAKDLVYAEEFDKYEKEGVIKFRAACSRDQEKKIYVQDRVIEDSQAIWTLFGPGQQEGTFFYCGPVGQPPAAIKSAIKEAFVKHGGLAADKADAEIVKMQIGGRFQLEAYQTTK